jgi:hypothetical protein
MPFVIGGYNPMEKVGTQPLMRLGIRKVSEMEKVEFSYNMEYVKKDIGSCLAKC